MITDILNKETARFYYVNWKYAQKDGNTKLAQGYKSAYRILAMESIKTTKCGTLKNNND